MAKLHADSDDELPDLSSVMATYAKADPRGPSTRSTVTPAQKRVQGPKSSQRNPSTSLPIDSTQETIVNIPSGDEKQRIRRQRPLRVAPVNSVLLSRWTGALEGAQALVDSASTGGHSVSASGISEWSAKEMVDGGHQVFGRKIHPRGPSDGRRSDIESPWTGKEVVGDAHSQPTRSPRRRHNWPDTDPEVVRARSTSLEPTTTVVGAASLRPDCVQASTCSGPSGRKEPLVTASFVFGDDLDSEPSAMLRLYLTTATRPVLHANVATSSPPRSRRRSPAKNKEQVCFTTPPATPSKSKLQSPKKQHRIPPSPHRPSIDAFWSQDVINDWNDEYSPRKTPKSGRARAIYSVIDEDDEELSPSTSPRKSPLKPPVKRDRKALEAKKAFNEKKHGLARAFLQELDDVVADGQIALLAASTGGVHLIWSKKLNSTAGRANWRQEVVRPNGSNEPLPSKYRHHASIELAEKVIDNENRLINVIAHEYCHLANFMISGIKNNPHGREFKLWARKCSEAFHHRGIEVTTKHSYIIDYKYIWECTNCSVEFKRHSKSIDPARHTCGSCKSKLVQTKPVPRTAAPSQYQLYFKAHFQQTKIAHPDISHKDVMGLIAKTYKEDKAKTCSTDAVPAMTELVDVPEEEEIVCEGVRREAEIDAVSRTLDFLSLTGG